MAVLARGVEARYLDSYRARQEDDELPRLLPGTVALKCGSVGLSVNSFTTARPFQLRVLHVVCQLLERFSFSMSSACSRLAIVAASLVAAASGSATVRQPFDPLVLLQDKAAQTTVLRSLARSANLEVATLALG